MLPFQSLAAATDVGPGSVLDLGTVADDLLAQIVVSAVSFSDTTNWDGTWNVGIHLEGSLDGANWFQLSSTAATVAGSVAAHSSGTSAGGTAKVGVSGTLTRYLRAHLDVLNVTNQYGPGAGTVSATVDAWIAVKASEEVP